MIEKYKKLFVVLFVIFSSFILTGCKVNSSSSPTAIATEQANTILECAVSNDAETLKGLFTPEIQETSELDGQIESFLDFIDGEIISYSEPSGGRGTGEVHDGKTVYQELNGNIYNIETDKGKIYEISHNAIRINDENPDEIGVYYISIVDTELFTAEAGYPESARAFIGDSMYTANRY